MPETKVLNCAIIRQQNKCWLCWLSFTSLLDDPYRSSTGICWCQVIVHHILQLGQIILYTCIISTHWVNCFMEWLASLLVIKTTANTPHSKERDYMIFHHMQLGAYTDILELCADINSFTFLSKLSMSPVVRATAELKA